MSRQLNELIYTINYFQKKHFIYMAVISSIIDWLLGTNRKVNVFQGKVVLVTGASSGIGKQLAKDLHKLGSKVILASRSTEQLAILR